MKPSRSILISGPSRTGKTTTADLLGARYGIERIKIGEKFRELTGIDVAKWVDRPEDLDRQIDVVSSLRQRLPMEAVLHRTEDTRPYECDGNDETA